MKNLNRKIFLSACVATMVASSAHAIGGGGSFSDTNLKDENKNGNYSFIDKNTGSTYNITSIIGSTFDGKTKKYINHLNIDAAKSVFNIDGSKQDAEIGYYYAKNEGKDKFYSFNIKAQELIFNGKDASLNVGDRGIIEGDLTLKDKANLFISNGTLGSQSANGSLLVKGNFLATDANLDFYGNHNFHVTGTAFIRNSNFSATNAPISENGIFLLSADKGFNKDIELTNTAGVYTAISTAQALGLSAEEAKKYEENIDSIKVDIKGVDHKIKVVGNSLYISAQVDTKSWQNSIKTDGLAKSLREAQKLALQSMIEEYTKLMNEAPGVEPKAANKQEFTKADYKQIIKDLTGKMNAINIDSKSPVFNSQIDAVLGSLLTSNRQQAAGSALTDAMVGKAQQAQNVINSARESANNSNRQGAIQVINLANEMAISTRMIQSRNQGENSIWSNAFGGANMIGSENDSIYGITLGIDRQFSDSILFGTYLTYADSKLSHNSINQDADNLQFGAYSRITNGQHEFDIKTYAQFSYTDQERFLNGTNNKSDYTQTFLGASGAYGYVLDMGDKFAIKPLIGLNLYYGKTPDYTENGVWAQKVYSMDSFAASAEIGAEFRKGFDGGSYFYITPKIEQFFATSGNDFKGRFAGSDMNYHVSGAEKDKTFGKLLIGSNIGITENLSVDLSLGAKQILGNKDDNTDETYFTGNIGFKYSF
ncbi:autotransporter outer membrane beta-barrel domain-containing protein [Campylobacter volucris]|uniref:autotransporter outer membrane beta-barrel domain-containing protein n=1 Tax=Campylobacter volucris TaxID=1031542 RepID=UPI00189E75F6|nr:autotransporter outer membrane beta-barrel domain-containing protein [Campylobacter volucris]MBF7067198.1 autotransporter outer membrane beta-barrel domain-containing protein [Campylobacter volucris]